MASIFESFYKGNKMGIDPLKYMVEGIDGSEFLDDMIVSPEELPEIQDGEVIDEADWDGDAIESPIDIKDIINQKLADPEKARLYFQKQGMRPEEIDNAMKSYTKQLQLLRAKPGLAKDIVSSDWFSKMGLKGARRAQPAERPQRLIHTSFLVGNKKFKGILISKEDGETEQIDIERFKDLISQPPTSIIGQNTKLKTSGSATNQIFYDLTLPAFQGLVYDEKDGQFKVLRTCPDAGKCKKVCYATSGGYIQYMGPWLNSTRVLNLLKNHPEEFKNKVIQELKSAMGNRAGKGVVLRFHDAGDFYSEDYLKLAYEIAKATPEVTHYAYTKRIAMVKGVPGKPDNFVFNFSFGGTQDRMIDKNSDKYSTIVPFEVFDALKSKIVKGVPLDPETKEQLKQGIQMKYDLEDKPLLTYDELVKIPYDPVKNRLAFNVIVRPGDGDDSAARLDVAGIFLLEH